MSAGQYMTLPPDRSAADTAEELRRDQERFAKARTLVKGLVRISRGPGSASVPKTAATEPLLQLQINADGEPLIFLASVPQERAIAALKRAREVIDNAALKLIMEASGRLTREDLDL